MLTFYLGSVNCFQHGRSFRVIKGHKAGYCLLRTYFVSDPVKVQCPSFSYSDLIHLLLLTSCFKKLGWCYGVLHLLYTFFGLDFKKYTQPLCVDHEKTRSTHTFVLVWCASAQTVTSRSSDPSLYHFRNVWMVMAVFYISKADIGLHIEFPPAAVFSIMNQRSAAVTFNWVMTHLFCGNVLCKSEITVQTKQVRF